MGGVQSPEVESIENWLHVVCDSTASASAEQRPREFCWVWHPAVINGALSRRLTEFRTVVRTTHQPLSQPMFLTVALYKTLLAGASRYRLDRLQSVLNTAARLLVGTKKHDSIRHVLRDRLHWVPVQQRVQFKLCLVTFKALHGLAPTYLADMCQPVASVGSRERLRSATRGDLVISPTVTYFNARSFAVAGPKAWNQLPADIRAIDSVNSFKSALKTFMFRW